MFCKYRGLALFNNYFIKIGYLGCSVLLLRTFILLEFLIYTEKVLVLLKLVLFFVLCFALFSFLSFDPIKSCLSLVVSVLFLSFVFRLSQSLWFSYFVCMLFLRGIFVILVYFSSLSKFFYFEYSSFSLFCALGFSLWFFVFYFYCFCVLEGLSVFYFSFFWFYFLYLVLFVLFFLFFISYFLNFSGALRGFFCLFVFQIFVFPNKVGTFHFYFDFFGVYDDKVVLCLF